MQDPGTHWSPMLSDHIHMVATINIGEVTEVLGAGDGRRFVVAIWPVPESPQHVAQIVMHRVCRLDDLAPARMP